MEREALRIRAAEASAFRRAFERQMLEAQQQMAGDLARGGWGDGPWPEPKPRTALERFGFRLGFWWYTARASVVRAVAWLLRVDR